MVDTIKQHDGRYLVYLGIEDVLQMATGEKLEIDENVSVIMMSDEGSAQLDDIAGAGVSLEYLKKTRPREGVGGEL